MKESLLGSEQPRQEEAGQTDRQSMLTYAGQRFPKKNVPKSIEPGCKEARWLPGLPCRWEDGDPDPHLCVKPSVVASSASRM